MSVIKVNNITNRDGTSGPVIAGIATVSTTSHMVVPTGRTGQRYVDGGENIVKDGLVLHLDAKYSYPSTVGIGTTTAGAAATPGSSVDGEPYTWYDMSGNENNMQLVNSVGFGTTNGGVLLFDGVNDYAIGNPINPSYITVSTWVKWNSFFADSSGHTIVSNSNASTDGYMLYQGTTAPYNVIQLFVRGGTFLKSMVSNSTLNTGQWYNISFTYDGSNIKLYINSALDKETLADIGPIKTSSNPFLISSTYTGGTSGIFGNIAQVAIYNKALTATEILQNYNALKSRFGL